MQYLPPAGILGDVAKLFGEEPEQQLKDDLGRLKLALESARKNLDAIKFERAVLDGVAHKAGVSCMSSFCMSPIALAELIHAIQQVLRGHV